MDFQWRLGVQVEQLKYRTVDDQREAVANLGELFDHEESPCRTNRILTMFAGQERVAFAYYVRDMAAFRPMTCPLRGQPDRRPDANGA